MVIGGTGAGKSAFCGLLEGSLKRDPNVKGMKAWSSNFKLGHSGNSETDLPELRVADWLGTDAEFPIVIVDTPGGNDTRGEQKDEQHLRETAGFVNCLRHIHLVIILVGNDIRLNRSIRETLLEFQKRFGKDLWAHSMVVVNRWDFDGDHLPEEFEQKFRQVLRNPIASQNQSQDEAVHFGLGLTEEECNKMLPFAFMKVQYRSDQTQVAKAMETELDKMKATLKKLEPWHVRVKAQSEPLNSLIDAVRKSNDFATLKQVFDSVNSTVNKPADLTQEKLDAVEREVARREDLEAATKSLTEAEQALSTFKNSGTKKDAETFVQKLDMAMKKLPDALMNLRISRLKPSWDMLKAGLEGKEDLCKDLRKDMPMDLQQKVDKLLDEVKGTKIIEGLLSAWNMKLSNDQLNQLYTLGVSSEEDLAQHISGLNNFPQAYHLQTKVLKDWNVLKNSPTQNLKWKDASDTVNALNQLLQDSQTANVPSGQVQKIKDKLKDAKAEATRDRKFTTLRLDMAWRPFGRLTGKHLKVSLKSAPEAFKHAAQKIMIEIKDPKGSRQESMKVLQQYMECQGGVQHYVLQIECETDNWLASGENLNATLVTSEEECSFSGEMTIPGKPTVNVPFDDKHWYCLELFSGGFLHVHENSKEGNAPIVRWWDENLHASQFRFEDTGEGKQEFIIYARHSGLAVTHGDVYHLPWTDLSQVHRLKAGDKWHDRQIWTVEDAGGGWYVIKSKQDHGKGSKKVISHSNPMHTLAADQHGEVNLLGVAAAVVNPVALLWSSAVPAGSSVVRFTKEHPFYDRVFQLENPNGGGQQKFLFKSKGVI